MVECEFWGWRRMGERKGDKVGSLGKCCNGGDGDGGGLGYIIKLLERFKSKK
jgi:hypothetical protein